MPGIGTVLDIMFRNWLLKGGVDPSQATIVEVANPQMMDALRNGSADAVVANDPIYNRLILSGVGDEAGKIIDTLPGEMPTIVYTVTQDWGEAHRDAIAAFQEAHRQGVAYAEAHPEAVRAILVSRLKLPQQVAQELDIPPFRPQVQPGQIAIMLDILNAQHQLVHAGMSPASLVWH